MTVTYTADVTTATFFCFGKLLFRWVGSIYKLMWKEFAVYFIIYYGINFIYKFLLNERQQALFETFCRYCDMHSALIPIAFVLGFYVAMVVGRWWEQYNMIPWPSRLALFVSTNIQDHGDRGRLLRRTVMRYVCLSQLIIFTSICPAVKKRFPTVQHIVDAGFLQGNEIHILEDIKTDHNKYFVPMSWACAVVIRARQENRILDDLAVQTLIAEINNFRGSLLGLLNFDWVSVPLVYTQVVTWAVYMFCFATMLGRQVLINDERNPIYIPLFSFLQFFFYMGWLKVAEALANPFGDDDDDFDMNAIVDRNLRNSYLMVDEIHQQHPQLVRDQYWDEVNFDLPYTAASLQYREDKPKFHLGTAAGIQVPIDQQAFVHARAVRNAWPSISTLRRLVSKASSATDDSSVVSKEVDQDLNVDIFKGSFDLREIIIDEDQKDHPQPQKSLNRDRDWLSSPYHREDETLSKATPASKTTQKSKSHAKPSQATAPSQHLRTNLGGKVERKSKTRPLITATTFTYDKVTEPSPSSSGSITPAATSSVPQLHAPEEPFAVVRTLLRKSKSAMSILQPTTPRARADRRPSLPPPVYPRAIVFVPGRASRTNCADGTEYLCSSVDPPSSDSEAEL